MKKLLALALALSLALFAAAALADDLNWSDVEAQATEIDAAFVSFDQVSAKMWVPTILEPLELTGEDIENDYIAYFATADGSAAVGVTYTDVGGMSLEEYAAAVAENGGTGIKNMTVNGLPCIGYDLEENDTSAVSFLTESGSVLEFAFSPMSDEGFATVALLMVASIQPM